MEGIAVQTPRGLERGELAVAVTGGGVEGEAERLEDAQRRQADGSDRRLRHVGGLQIEPLLIACGVVEGGVGVDELGQATIGAEDLIGRAQCLACDGELAREVAQHVGILGTLTGEQCGDLAFRAAAEIDPLGRGPVAGTLALEQLAGRAEESAGTLALFDDEQAAGCACIECGAETRGPGAQLTPAVDCLDALELSGNGIAIRPTEGEDLCASVPVHRLGGSLVFLEHAMEIAAAEAERTDAGTACAAVAQPGALLGVDVERCSARQGRVGRLVDLDGRGQRSAVERHRRFDDAGGAGGGLGVADHRLDRTECAPWFLIGLELAVHHFQAADFDGITDLGAGAVGLDEFDGAGVDSRGLVGRTQCARLAVGARCVDRVALTVAGRADAANDRVDPVTIAFRVLESFQHDQAQTLAEDRAVTVLGERLAVAGRRQRRCFAETHEHEDVIEGVQTSGNHHVRASRLELEHRQVHRAQGRGAGGVDDTVGAVQIQAVGDAARGDVAEQAGEGVLLPADVALADTLDDVVSRGRVHACVVQCTAPDRMAEARAERDHQLEGAGHAEHDADPLLIEVGLVGRVARVAQCFLRYRQAEQLGRVRRLHVARRDAKLEWVEVNGIEEAAAAAVGLVRRARVLVEVVFRLPVCRRGLADAVASVLNVLPVGRQIHGLWEHATDADDGDRAGRTGGLLCGGLGVRGCAWGFIAQVRHSSSSAGSRGARSRQLGSTATP